jgi:hypothetical protein
MEYNRMRKPLWLVLDGFKFGIFPNENEIWFKKPHVHIVYQKKHVKIAIETLQASNNEGFSASEIRDLKEVVKFQKENFLDFWNVEVAKDKKERGIKDEKRKSLSRKKTSSKGKRRRL